MKESPFNITLVEIKPSIIYSEWKILSFNINLVEINCRHYLLNSTI